VLAGFAQNNKMKKSLQFLMGLPLLFMALGCNANIATEIPTLTNTPLPSLTPTVMPIKTPKPTSTPIPTPTPVFVILGSPFSPDCGDGTPRIVSNTSFNGVFRQEGFDQFHGHVDFVPPSGCNAEIFQGEVIAPASGVITPYHDNPYGFHLTFPTNTFPAGIAEALIFAGVQNPDLSKITDIKLNFGHVILQTGTVEKGEIIGDLHSDYPHANPWKIAYQITFLINGTGYMFTPTLFEHDPPFPWLCISEPKTMCEPVPNNYAP
jgi:hypothetical protein